MFAARCGVDLRRVAADWRLLDGVKKPAGDHGRHASSQGVAEAENSALKCFTGRGDFRSRAPARQRDVLRERRFGGGGQVRLRSRPVSSQRRRMPKAMPGSMVCDNALTERAVRRRTMKPLKKPLAKPMKAAAASARWKNGLCRSSFMHRRGGRWPR